MPLSSPPRVTLLMSAYNAAATLPRTLASIAAQDMPYWRLIVVNDGSTDGTRTFLDQVAQADPRIQVVHLPKNGGGQGPGLNAAWAYWRQAIAQGEGQESPTVGFLDADDWLPTDSLSARLAAFSTHPEAVVVYGAYQRTTMSGSFINGPFPPIHPETETFLDEHSGVVTAENLLYSRCSYQLQGMLIQTTALQQYAQALYGPQSHQQLFPDWCLQAADYYFATTFFATLQRPWVGIPKVVFYFCTHPNSVTQSRGQTPAQRQSVIAIERQMNQAIFSMQAIAQTMSHAKQYILGQKLAYRAFLQLLWNPYPLGRLRAIADYAWAAKQELPLQPWLKLFGSILTRALIPQKLNQQLSHWGQTVRGLRA